MINKGDILPCDHGNEDQCEHLDIVDDIMDDDEPLDESSTSSYIPVSRDGSL